MTRSGVVMAGATVGLLLAGAWADYPELVTLGFAGLGALVTAVAWLFVRPQLTAGREVRPRRVFEGSAARGLLTATNVGRRRSPPLLATETVGGHCITVPIPALVGGQSLQVGYPLPTERRGRYVIPPLVLSQSDPLRLLHRRRALGAGLVLHVYPRVHPLAMVTAGGPRDAEGPTASSAPPGGVAFHSLREYLLGDDWRLIHWGATARTGTLMARHLVVPDEPRQLVVLDTSAAPYTATMFEDAVRVAASFCVAAEQAGLPAQLRTTGDATGGVQWPDGEWGRDLSATLEFLSVVDSGGVDRGLAALLDTVRDVISADHGVALVVVTGRVDAGQAELLTLVRPRFLSVSLAQLVTAEPASTARPPGVLAVAAPTSAKFAVSWNRLVLR
ncbi:uncharacterized protein (DUF58 family) [Kibdelosporangium banguiense]|uniref:Uncharacterized protein (DUF58 family) n=1 Tax=Kibdelosporangium banguiense TaxID=1365924 RepID=A0ABS4TYV7_9PSEU|nr:DUF58 domain-containing protein [Kibdelosporangium banguiense]MBP2329592.1 uncharacterized protein (DUF58 family) [Kibdelosporangium banguiense]